MWPTHVQLDWDLMPDLFVASLSGASARQAVVEETASSAWLYMTSPEGAEPIAGCFLYNVDGDQHAGGETPPPLADEYASDFRVELPVTEDDIELLWSSTGEAVAVRIRGVITGFISSTDLLGYSRSVNQECDWAHPFDSELFSLLFQAA